MYLNKSLKELHIMNQSYFRTESKLVESDVKQSMQHKDNKTLERLSMSLGVMKTIKPLVKCFCTFTKLKEFSLTNVELNTKMHF